MWTWKHIWPWVLGKLWQVPQQLQWQGQASRLLNHSASWPAPCVCIVAISLEPASFKQAVYLAGANSTSVGWGRLCQSGMPPYVGHSRPELPQMSMWKYENLPSVWNGVEITVLIANNCWICLVSFALKSWCWRIFLPCPEHLWDVNLTTCVNQVKIQRGMVNAFAFFKDMTPCPREIITRVFFKWSLLLLISKSQWPPMNKNTNPQQVGISFVCAHDGCVGMCECMHVHISDNFVCHFSGALYFLFETWSLIGLDLHQVGQTSWLGNSKDLPVSAPPSPR